MNATQKTPMLGVFVLWVSEHFEIVPRQPPELRILGDAIRRSRKRAGFSQEKLAEKSSLHPVYIGKIERGEQWVSLHALLRLAKAMGIKARDLIKDL